MLNHINLNILYRNDSNIFGVDECAPADIHIVKNDLLSWCHSGWTSLSSWHVLTSEQLVPFYIVENRRHGYKLSYYNNHSIRIYIYLYVPDHLLNRWANLN